MKELSGCPARNIRGFFHSSNIEAHTHKALRPKAKGSQISTKQRPRNADSKQLLKGLLNPILKRKLKAIK